MAEGEIKLNRRRIAEKTLRGEWTELERTAGQEGDPLTKEIIQLLADTLQIDPAGIQPDTDFFLDAGGTSLDYLTVAAALHDKYGVTFPATGGRSMTTPAETAAFIRKELGM